jgi:hypothetical protein
MKRKPEPHLSARALSRETGLDRSTITKRLEWGYGEATADKHGRPTLRGFISNLDGEDLRKAMLFRLKKAAVK